MHDVCSLEIRGMPLRSVARMGKDIPELGRLSVLSIAPIRLRRFRDRGIGMVGASSPSFGASLQIMQ
jgi:hypothetical protein